MYRKFYDIHYHLFDLSHPNLQAFILRDDLVTSKTVRKVMLRLPFLLQFLPLWIASLFPGKVAAKVKGYIKNDAKNLRNLLSVIEGAIEYHFLYVEYFLNKMNKEHGSLLKSGYNKIVLCPLLMDFGYKNLKNDDCFYNLPPAKPIVNQVVDIINAIWFYYHYDLIPHPDKLGRLKIVPAATPKEKKLFEIYPFLGINTQNYDLQEIVELFDKYFAGYEDDENGSTRQKKLYDRSGSIKADLEDMIFKSREKSDSDYYSYLFAGIKLYPPLGFDPWPETDQRELEKVRFLYSECTRKRIPITVHCSDKGYITSPDAEKLTNPSSQWKKVLSRPEYRDLKINFAHIGNRHDGRDDWKNTILEYIKQNRNIYTDFSCQTPQKEDYERVKVMMTPAIENNVLFGSDFVINLIWSGSYNEYLLNFLNTDILDESQKKLLCEVNPERFLFGI
jgi:hypothetical protein